MPKEMSFFIKELEFRIPFGEPLFSNVNFVAHKGDKIGFIGPNGSGKSTILKIIAGLMEPTMGRKETYGKVVYLPQVNFDLAKDKQVYEFLAELTDDWWEAINYAQNNFGLKDISPNQKIGTLSGGELMKLYISRFLMVEPDILLLDEPTNHIDVLSLEVLIETIKKFPGTVVFASHDTFFLNQCSTRIIALEDGTMNNYGGNYDHYIKMRLMLDNGLAKDIFALRQKQTRLVWAIKHEAKRSTKNAERGYAKFKSGSMSRYEMGYFKEKAGKATAKITKALDAKRDKVSEKLKVMVKPPRKVVDFKFAAGKTIPEDLLVFVKNATLAVDSTPLIREINLQISRGQRVAILGKNGVGKTLLLKSILHGHNEHIKLDGEEVILPEISAEYIGQDFGRVVDLESQQTKTLDEALVGDDTNIFKSLIGQLGMDRTDVYRSADSFSGGELTKLLLLDISNKPLDMLVLDEPTNHLDIQSQDSLISALNSFNGTLVVTSHKMEFLSKLQLTDVFVIANEQLVRVHGDFEDPQFLYKTILNSNR